MEAMTVLSLEWLNSFTQGALFILLALNESANVSKDSTVSQ